MLWTPYNCANCPVSMQKAHGFNTALVTLTPNNKTRIACLDINVIRSEYSLAYEEYIDGAEIEFVKIRQCCKTIIGRMLASVELEEKSEISLLEWLSVKLTITVLPLYWMI